MKVQPDVVLCCAQIRIGTTFARYRQCTNKMKLYWCENEDDPGKPYCGIHDPSKKRKVRQNRKVRFDEKMQKLRLEIAAPHMFKWLTRFVEATKLVKGANSPRVPLFPELLIKTPDSAMFQLIKEARAIVRDITRAT